jgi:NAD/NADP transhydrogenase beta subunit
MYFVVSNRISSVHRSFVIRLSLVCISFGVRSYFVCRGFVRSWFVVRAEGYVKHARANPGGDVKEGYVRELQRANLSSG